MAITEDDPADKDVVFPSADGNLLYRLGSAEVVGGDVASADPQFDPTGQAWTVLLELTGEGRRKFGDVTTRLARAAGAARDRPRPARRVGAGRPAADHRRKGADHRAVHRAGGGGPVARLAHRCAAHRARAVAGAARECDARDGVVTVGSDRRDAIGLDRSSRSTCSCSTDCSASSRSIGLVSVHGAHPWSHRCDRRVPRLLTDSRRRRGADRFGR